MSHDPLLIAPAVLERNHHRLANRDAAVVRRFEPLRQHADTWLSASCPTVMNKPTTPPSGDKHDYMSIGPYWWPDPSKPDGLPWIRRDGQTNPASRNQESDHTASQQMVAGVKALTLAYRLSHDPAYARKAGQLLRTWFIDPATRMNPHLNFGQAIPGVNTGRGIGIIETSAYIMLLDHACLLTHAPGWSEADAVSLQQWFDAYLTWLLESEHGQFEDRQLNNHGSWYDAQVVRFALYVGREDVARSFLEKVVERRVSHIQPDGSQPLELARTRSLQYTCYNLEALLLLCVMADHLHMPIKQARTPTSGSIADAVNFLLPYGNPDTPWPWQQLPSDTNPRHTLVRIIRLGLKVYRDPKYTHWLKTSPVAQSARDDSALHIDED